MPHHTWPRLWPTVWLQCEERVAVECVSQQSVCRSKVCVAAKFVYVAQLPLQVRGTACAGVRLSQGCVSCSAYQLGDGGAHNCFPQPLKLLEAVILPVVVAPRAAAQQRVHTAYEGKGRGQRRAVTNAGTMARVDARVGVKQARHEGKVGTATRGHSVVQQSTRRWAGRLRARGVTGPTAAPVFDEQKAVSVQEGLQVQLVLCARENLPVEPSAGKTRTGVTVPGGTVGGVGGVHSRGRFTGAKLQAAEGAGPAPTTAVARMSPTAPSPLRPTRTRPCLAWGP